MKLRVPPGPARAEVMQLVDVFRARVVDVSEKTLTLAVTGDAGKVKHIAPNLCIVLSTMFRYLTSSVCRFRVVRPQNDSVCVQMQHV